MSSTTIHSEHPTHSPYERANRIRRCATAIKQGTSVKALEKSKRFKREEIALAQEMLEEAERRKKA